MCYYMCYMLGCVLCGGACMRSWLGKQAMSRELRLCDIAAGQIREGGDGKTRRCMY